MNSCGLIVEYNPFHNGHVYHIQEAKKQTNADCMIAVMSGSFLQRGEPAIIDKYHRARAALSIGIDLVVELPYAYAVQNSDLFAKGAVQTLNAALVNSICFGSESGHIEPFHEAYNVMQTHDELYQSILKQELNKGKSFPKAHEIAFQQLPNFQSNHFLDLSAPNNILGYSYLKEILDHGLNILPYTIKRTKSGYHDTSIQSEIASATAIRKSILEHETIPKNTMPDSTYNELIAYEQKTSHLHFWEAYFPLLQYRVLTMSIEELNDIHGMDEGLEYRIKQTAKEAQSIEDWITKVKTKRYTWTRVQRLFTHLLTNTKKSDMSSIQKTTQPAYIRILGMNHRGRAYVNQYKNDFSLPILTRYSKKQPELLSIEERASHAYYSILPPNIKKKLYQQELSGPIIL